MLNHCQNGHSNSFLPFFVTFLHNHSVNSALAVVTELEIKIAPHARIITCKLRYRVKFMLNVWRDALP